jgi:PEP-CTERM motif
MRFQRPAWLLIGLALLLGVAGATAQGTFQNLGFESALVSGHAPHDGLPITSALPGWAAGVDGADKTATVYYDAVSLGGPFIAINDANTGFGFTPIQGRFSACLFSTGGNLPVATSISQTGLVPADTMSLQAQMVVQGPTPVVMLGGQVINMVPLAAFPAYTLYGADVSAFAGQTATLSFTEPPPGQASVSSLELDGIVFSSEPIPEPGTIAMLSLGALLVGWHVLRRRR